ncbi:hypothetical protein Scep_017566 [Stephania cephalantha]|uniref:Uncharacterized protein n=1 Tax=Stephania cephalantha TaxID=152367 RepID=A0AAP0IPQ6_9MAGN
MLYSSLIIVVKTELAYSLMFLNTDESRNAACSLFPSMASLLKRKKDHGRAGALLIVESRQTKS